MWKNFVDFTRVDKEEILAQSRTSFGANGHGYLHVTNFRVLWTPPATKKPKLSLFFSQIKVSQAQLPDDKPDTKAKLAIKPVDNEDRFIFEFIDPHSKWEDLKGVQNLLRQAITPHNEQRKKKLMKESQVQISRQRADLLARNEDIRLIYSRLVPQTLSEEEFWASRSGLIEQENAIQKQQIGMSTSMLTDIKPNAEINRHVYRLTPQVIHQIFVEYPWVRDIYEENVPHKLTEKEFWEQYFQSEYFQRTRQQYSSKSFVQRPKRTNFNDIFSSCENERGSSVPSITLAKIESSADLSLDEGNPVGYGMPLDSKMDSSILENSVSLIRRYNRHSSLVLQNPSINDSLLAKPTKKKDTSSLFDIGIKRKIPNLEDIRNKKRLCPSAAERTILGDLLAEKKLTTIPLKITNQRRYFQSSSDQSSAMDIDGTSSSQLDTFKDTLRDWNSSLENRELSSELCYQVLNTICVPTSSRGATKEDRKAFVLDDTHKALLKADFLESNELLRHFWGSFPLTSSRQLKKAKRLGDALCVYYDNIQKKHEEMLQSSNSQQKEYGNLLRPITKSVHNAITYFEKTKLG